MRHYEISSRFDFKLCRFYLHKTSPFLLAEWGIDLVAELLLLKSSTLDRILRSR